MALVPCPSCKKPVSDQATACPQCGHPVKATLESQKPFTDETDFYTSYLPCSCLVAILTAAAICGGWAFFSWRGR